LLFLLIKLHLLQYLRTRIIFIIVAFKHFLAIIK